MVTPRIGGVRLDLYGADTTPLVTVRSEERTVTHDRVGKEPKIQRLGPELDEVNPR
jgi:hypothetical protein